MAEQVEVVIKIPKYYLAHPEDYTCLAECVRRGTPLPKGHGDLVDKQKILLEIETVQIVGSRREYDILYSSDVENARPVIEADKEGER